MKWWIDGARRGIASYAGICYTSQRTGRSSAWLERLVWDQEVAGSNPVAPIKIPCKCRVFCRDGLRGIFCVPAIPMPAILF